MKRNRVKGYWKKCKEAFQKGADAKARAGYLRLYKEIQHVVVEKESDTYYLKYSVAKWYAEQLDELGIQL